MKPLRRPHRPLLRSALVALPLLALFPHAQAASQAEEDAALDLQADAPPAPGAGTGTPAAKSWSLSTELAGVHVVGRTPWPSQDAARLAASLRGEHAFSNAWGLRYAARLDAYSRHLDALGGATPDAYARSGALQEFYARWTPSAAASLQIGRINIREGSAFSFNPVDVYRSDSVKMFVHPSPLVTRESRQGTFGLRGQWNYAGGSASLTYSPKLGTPDSPYTRSRAWGLDATLTNPAHSALAVWSHSFSDAVNAKLLAFKASDGRWQLGSSGSALVSNALTLHFEAAQGRMLSAQSMLGNAPQTATGRQWALGGTWTIGQWSWTLEHAYNGLAMSGAGFAGALAGAPAGAYGYLVASERLQTLAPRRQWFLYVSRPDLFMPRLDFKAFVSQNPHDHGATFWLEARKRFTDWDLSYQWLATTGSQRSMSGVLPARHIHQLVLSHYF